MHAVAGADRTKWHDRVGLFGPGSPLANEAGIEVLSGPRDYNKVRRDLAEAGYRDEPIVVLGVTGAGNVPPISQVGVDQLRKAGMNVDLQMMDIPTMNRRRMSNATNDKGGWNVYFSILEGLYNANPATNAAIRGDGKSGMPGWPTSAGLEASRDAWLDTEDLATQSRSACGCNYRCGRTCGTFRWGTGCRRPRTDVTSSISHGAFPRSMACEGFDQMPLLVVPRNLTWSLKDRFGSSAAIRQRGRECPLWHANCRKPPFSFRPAFAIQSRCLNVQEGSQAAVPTPMLGARLGAVRHANSGEIG